MKSRHLKSENVNRHSIRMNAHIDFAYVYL